MPRLATLAIVLAGALAAHGASAQFAKTEDAISYRQSTMFVQGQHFGRLAAMANGRVPFDAATAAANAEVVAYMTRLHWPGFVAGTEGGKAKEGIWKESAKFKELSDKLQADGTTLVAATKAGSLDALKAAVNQTGQTCKACHDEFRSR